MRALLREDRGARQACRRASSEAVAKLRAHRDQIATELDFGVEAIERDIDSALK